MKFKKTSIPHNQAIGDSLVTVYIVNHNYAKYIEQAIESVLNQKFRDLELIIIDDGSTDNSKEVITKYKNNPLTKIVYQHNKGLNISNNIALNLAKGKYIMRLDADDYLDENAILIMVTTLEKDDKISLVYPDYYMVDEKGNVFAHERRQNLQSVTLRDRPAHGACTMIRKNSLIEVGGYFEDFKCQDGYDIWMKFIKRFKIANINLPLFYYRQHEKNLTRNQGKLLTTRHEIIKKFLNTKEINRKKHIGIIPIRGGGEESRLALRKFGDTTVLDTALTNALASENISKIILTTPECRLINYVQEKYGRKIIINKRPDKLAALNTKLEEVIDYLIERHKTLFAKADTITMINFNYPFRESIYIDKAINTLYLFDVDAVLSVKQVNANFFRHDGNGLIPFKTNRELRLERDVVFEEIGGIHVVRYNSYRKHKSLIAGKVGHVVIDDLSAIKLSNELNFEIAKLLYRKKQKECKNG